MGKIASSLPAGKLRRFRCVGVWLALLAAVLFLLLPGRGGNTVTDGSREFPSHTAAPETVPAEAGSFAAEDDRQVLRQEQVYTGIIPHEVRYCYDSSLTEGTEAVLVEGVDGLTACRATVTYVNGVETGRKLTGETVTRQPVTEVIALGTAPAEDIDPEGMPLIGDGMIILPTGEVLTYTGTMQVVATAYHKSDAGCDDWTATMTLARVGAIAVDPRVIPYGTRMFIVSNDGVYVYGLATAEDCGGAIKGARVDLYYDTVAECNAFGRRDCTVYFLG